MIHLLVHLLLIEISGILFLWICKQEQ